MKIVCDSCGAKYSIADEKVAGKIFKIRCKKCSSVLEVRGDQTGAHALETSSQPQDPVADAGWYIVVDAEQRGPLSPIELSQLFAKGSVGLDSYVWKEGFDDWKVAADVPELVQILGGAGSATKGETSKITTDSSASFGNGGDLFAEGNGREPTGEIITHGEGSVFGDPSEPANEPVAADEAPIAAETAAEGAAAEGFGAALGGAAAEPARMTGQRNENSVLFSLSNLQQLASRGGGEPVAQAVQPQAAASPQAAGAAGEGSGLIDIRALAKSTTPGTRTAPSQAVDDLLALGTAGGGGTLGAPLLGPTPIETSSNNRWLWIAGIAVAVIGTVGMGLGLGVMLGGSSDDDGLEVAGEEQAPAPGEIAVAAAAPTEIDEEPGELPDAEPEQAAGFEEPAEEPLEAPDFEEPQQARAKPTKQRATGRRRRTRTTSSAAATPAPAPTKRRSGNNLDALMDEVVGGSSAKKSAPTAAKSGRSGSTLPDAPSRGDVKKALQGVSGGVKACNKGAGGTALVDVTFSGGTGRVSRAKLTSGPLKGTLTAACVERAVKRARVPRFKQSSFKVKFPYRL